MPTDDLTKGRFVDDVVIGGWVRGLKRYTGARYLEAVRKCLNKEFNAIWEAEDADFEEYLAVWLPVIRNAVLDRIAGCNA